MTDVQAGPLPRNYAFTLFILFANLGAYLFLLSKGVAPLEPKPDSLIAWGGNLPVLTLTGDYWRLGASLFLHGGLLHLAANMYMLIIIGPLAEKRFGSLGMATVYLGGGLLSSLVSAWWGECTCSRRKPSWASLASSMHPASNWSWPLAPRGR